MRIKSLQTEAVKDVFSTKALIGLSAAPGTIAAIGATFTAAFGLPNSWAIIILCIILTSLNISPEEVKYKIQLIPLFLIKVAALFFLTYSVSSGIAIGVDTLPKEEPKVALSIEEDMGPPITAASEEVVSRMEAMPDRIVELPEPQAQPPSKKNPWRVEFVK